MKNKRYSILFMLLVSVLMLAVPVIPHHHHFDGGICMKHDAKPEHTCSNPAHHHSHSHSAPNDFCSNSECMTQLNSTTVNTQTSQGPQFLFITTLFSDLVTEHLLKPQERQLKNNYAYLESLHGTNITRAFALRGPPCFSVA